MLIKQARLLSLPNFALVRLVAFLWARSKLDMSQASGFGIASLKLVCGVLAILCGFTKYMVTLGEFNVECAKKMLDNCLVCDTLLAS